MPRSVAQALWLYRRSFAPGALLALGGNTGQPMYDLFIGRELNPRVGSLDLKEFCELYPGLIGWATLNLAYAAKQYELTGGVSAAMVLVNAFQARAPLPFLGAGAGACVSSVSGFSSGQASTPTRAHLARALVAPPEKASGSDKRPRTT